MTAEDRTARTRQRLHDAVLELAGERSIAEVTATDVANRAGVHRTTFYEYAASPVDLLRAALAVELDALRERLHGVTGADGGRRAHEVTVGVLDHLERHAAVYRRLDDTAGSALQAFLSEHFQESERLVLAQGVARVPAVVGVDPEAATAVALRYLADAHVGAFAVWLRTPEPRDREALFRSLDVLLPAWWPNA